MPAFCWKRRDVQRLWGLADRLVQQERRYETEPNDWVDEAAEQVAIAAAIVENDAHDDREQRAFARVQAWRNRNHYNTNAYHTDRLRWKLGLRREPPRWGR